jgi:heterokaryon incompatibility protein (HET)
MTAAEKREAFTQHSLDEFSRPQIHQDVRINSNNDNNTTSGSSSLKRSATQRIPAGRDEASAHRSPRRSRSNGNLRDSYEVRTGVLDKQRSIFQKRSIDPEDREARLPLSDYEKEGRIRANVKGVHRQDTENSGQLASRSRRTPRSPEHETSNSREYRRRDASKTVSMGNREDGRRTLPGRALSAIRHWLPLDINSNIVYHRDPPPLVHRTLKKTSTSLRQEYASLSYHEDLEKRRDDHLLLANNRLHSRPSTESPGSDTFRKGSFGNELTRRGRNTPPTSKRNARPSSRSTTRSADREGRSSTPQITKVSEYHRLEILHSNAEKDLDDNFPGRTMSKSSTQASSTLEDSQELSDLKTVSNENEAVHSHRDISDLIPAVEHRTLQQNGPGKYDTLKTNPSMPTSQTATSVADYAPPAAKVEKLRNQVLRGHHATKVPSYRDSLSTTLSIVENLGEEEHRSFTPPQRALSSTSPANQYKNINDNLNTSSIERMYKSVKYERLTDADFRILIIEPGAVGSKIVTTLKLFNFSDSPMVHYEALSYVWGQEPAIHRIIVNENPHFIRPNLFHALQRIRAQSQRVYLWVDSLCIDQQNEFERNVQVRQMDRIYQNADNVCIWLGEEDSKSKIAMDFVPKASTLEFFRNPNWWKDFRLTALNQFLEKSWFRRGWVIQEAAFSQNSVIFCGQHQIRMKSFDDAIKFIRKRLKSIPQSPGRPVNDTLVKDILYNFHDSPATRLLDTIEHVFLKKGSNGSILRKSMSLEALVELGTFCETTDPRDAIYALLNLASDTAGLNDAITIIPDYGRSLLDVYSDFIVHCCEKSDSLDIICRPWAPVPEAGLGLGFNGSDANLQSQLPSWIATRDRLPFGDPSQRNTRRLHGNPLVGSCRHQVHKYTAHDMTHPQIRIGKSANSNACNGSLYAKGIMIGEINYRSTRMADAIVSKECLDMLSHGTGWRSSEPSGSPDIVWRTLCANRDDKGQPAQSVYSFAMLELLHAVRNTPSGVSSIDVEELLDRNIPDDVAEYLRVIRETV